MTEHARPLSHGTAAERGVDPSAAAPALRTRAAAAFHLADQAREIADERDRLRAWMVEIETHGDELSRAIATRALRGE